MRRDFVPLVRDHVKRADGVICVSEYTASEARRLLDVPDGEDRGHAARRRPRLPQEPPAERGRRARCAGCALPRGGILYVGSDEKRKNLVTLVMAYMTLARRRPACRRSCSAGPGLRLGAGRQPRRARRSWRPATSSARHPRADGRLRRARPALARGGLRPAGGRGDGGRPARRLLARLGARGGRGRRRDASSTRSTSNGARARASSACSRTARSPRSCAAAASSAAARFDWEHHRRAHARLLPARSLAASPLRRRDRRPRARRGARPARAATCATCCAHWREARRHARRLLQRRRARSTPCSTTRRSACAPLGDGGARGLVVAGAAAARAPPARDGLDVFFSPAYSCPLRLDVPRVTAVHDLSFFAHPQDFAWLDGAAPARARARRRCARRASCRSCSEFTRARARAALPRPRPSARSTSRSARTTTCPPARRAPRRAGRLGVAGPLVLTVGAILNRRCLPELLRAVGAPARARTPASCSTSSARTARTRGSTSTALVAALGLARQRPPLRLRRRRRPRRPLRGRRRRRVPLGVRGLRPARARGRGARRAAGGRPSRPSLGEIFRGRGARRRPARRARRWRAAIDRVLRDAADARGARRGGRGPRARATRGPTTARLHARGARCARPADERRARASPCVVVSFETRDDAARGRSTALAREPGADRDRRRRQRQHTTARPRPCASASRGVRLIANPRERRLRARPATRAARASRAPLRPLPEPRRRRSRPGARRRRSPRCSRRGTQRRRSSARARAAPTAASRSRPARPRRSSRELPPAPARARRRAPRPDGARRGRGAVTPSSTSPTGSPARACWSAARPSRRSPASTRASSCTRRTPTCACRVRQAGWRVLFTPAAEVAPPRSAAAWRGPRARARSSTTAATCATTASTVASCRAALRLLSRARLAWLAALAEAPSAAEATRARHALRGAAVGRHALGRKRSSCYCSRWTWAPREDRDRRAQVARLRDRHVRPEPRAPPGAPRPRDDVLPLLQPAPTSRRCATWPRTSCRWSTARPRYGLREHVSIPLQAAPARRRPAHSPHYVRPLLCPMPSVVTIHDCIHLLFPQYLPNRMAYRYARFMMGSAIRNSALVFTVSEASRARHPALLPRGRSGEGARGPERDRRGAARWTRARRSGARARALPDPRPLRALRRQRQAAQEPRAADPGLRPRARPGGQRGPAARADRRRGQPLRARCAAASRRRACARTCASSASCPTETLAALYRMASVFAFPSLYEGFGLPPLEAMACGTPVVTSRHLVAARGGGRRARCSSTPTARTTSPHGIARLLDDQDLRARLVERGLARARARSAGSARCARSTPAT